MESLSILGDQWSFSIFQKARTIIRYIYFFHFTADINIRQFWVGSQHQSDAPVKLDAHLNSNLNSGGRGMGSRTMGSESRAWETGNESMGIASMEWTVGNGEIRMGAREWEVGNWEV